MKCQNQRKPEKGKMQEKEKLQMVGINPSISVVTENVNGLNTLIVIKFLHFLMFADGY